MNCTWAQALTKYDCRPLTGTDGQPCLEIGTPFSLPDGSAINLYLMDAGTHIRISDNADTLFQLSGMGLDVWQAARFNALRDFVGGKRMQLAESGELYMLAKKDQAAAGFAIAVTGLIAVSMWASEKLSHESPEVDLVAELQPYIIARDALAKFERHPKVKGASRAVHQFDLRHGNDLIDIIPANALSTGSAMRKAGDVQNGPFAEDASPLIIVDDRKDPMRAASEIGILGSVTRAQAASELLRILH